MSLHYVIEFFKLHYIFWCIGQKITICLVANSMWNSIAKKHAFLAFWSKCNFIEFKDSSVDAIVLNLAASVYYHDFRPYYFCSYFLSCPLKFPITHFLKQLISIPEWIQTSFIKVSPTLDQISAFAWNLVPCYQHCLKRLYSQLFWKFWQISKCSSIKRQIKSQTT